MENTPDETKLKQLVKSAVVEALNERESMRNNGINVGGEIPSIHSKSTLRVVLLWVLLLITAVGLWNLVERTTAR